MKPHVAGWPESPAIELRNVSIRFCRLTRRRRTVSGLLRERLAACIAATRSSSADHPRRRRPWVLDAINLQVGAGESVGLVGLNGAGKSTLLRVMAGIYRPTTGEATVRGEVSALLGLNTGFRSELTGLENIRLGGMLLGLSRREVDELTPKIVEFSGLGDAVRDPVSTYSSGMLARLGFAIATAVEPSVLLVDELLGVGDGRFRRRSEARLHQLMERARILLVCSHNLDLIRQQCGRVIWLDGGQVAQDGPAAAVLADYRDFLRDTSRDSCPRANAL